MEPHPPGGKKTILLAVQFVVNHLIMDPLLFSKLKGATTDSITPHFIKVTINDWSEAITTIIAAHILTNCT